MSQRFGILKLSAPILKSVVLSLQFLNSFELLLKVEVKHFQNRWYCDKVGASHFCVWGEGDRTLFSLNVRLFLFVIKVTTRLHTRFFLCPRSLSPLLLHSSLPTFPTSKCVRIEAGQRARARDMMEVPSASRMSRFSLVNSPALGKARDR